MKKPPASLVSHALPWLSASVLLAAAVANGQTTFSFYFNNNSGTTRNSSLHQWATSVGAAGTTVNTYASGSGISNGNALAAIAGQSGLAGYAFYVPGTGVAPGALLLAANNTNSTNSFQGLQDTWFRTGTGSMTGLTVADITQLSVYTRPADTTTEMRLAIKVDGGWYASATSFIQTDVNAWEQRTVVPSSISWISSIGTPGSSLDLDLSDNSAAPLNSGGVVTAYGLYADTGALPDTSARVRIDSYEVVTTVSGDPPAPATIAITPAGASLSPLGSQQFSAVLYDQYNQPVDPQPSSFSWSVSGGGSIGTTGIFFAGATAGSFTVSASAVSITGNTGFTIAELTGSTTFSAFFNNGTGNSSDKTAAVYNWAAAVGASGTIVNSPSTAAGVSQGGSDTSGVPVIDGASTKAGYLFNLPSGAPGAQMLYRSSVVTSDAFQDAPQGNWFRAGSANLSGLTLAAIDQLSVYTRPANTATEMRFTIQVGGTWYASATAFTQTDVNLWEQKVINPATINWISGVGNPGTSLDTDLIDNSSAPFAPESVITGYGLYADSGVLTDGSARVRIDSYQIKTVQFGSNAYDNWATGPFAHDLLDKTAGVDFDNDGLVNLLEFVLGGDPTVNDNPSVLPVVGVSGSDLVLTFHRSDASEVEPVALQVQVSDGLVTWNPADEIAIGADTASSDPEVEVTENVDAPDTIVVTIPKAAAARKFARVVATK